MSDERITEPDQANPLTTMQTAQLWEFRDGFQGMLIAGETAGGHLLTEHEAEEIKQNIAKIERELRRRGVKK